MARMSAILWVKLSTIFKEEKARMTIQGTEKSTKATSSRKIEANRRNAQRSTGPKTPEGKATSSQNSRTHGIFVKKFLNSATPETVAEIEALAAGIWEHYQPVGMLEELLVQKIVIEAARDHRVLGFEQGFTGPPIHVVACLGLMARYSTSTSRALFRAIQELERIQAARKARETSAASTVAESALPVIKQEQPHSEVVHAVPGDSSAPEGPEGADGEAAAA